MTEMMTSADRLQAYQAGQAVDRRPIMLFHGTVGAKLAGMTYRESEMTAENIAYKEITVAEKFAPDNYSVNFGLYGMGHALGSQFKASEDSSDAIVSYALDDLAGIDQLDVASLRLRNDPNQQKHYEAIELIQKELGPDYRIDYELSGPITSAASLYPPEQLLRATRKKTDQVHQLLRFATDALLQIIDDFAAANPSIGFSLTDPVASGALLSPKQYEKFCQPYTKEIVDRIHHYGKSVTLHICGDCTKSLPYIAGTGIDYFSADQTVDLQAAKAGLGPDCGLIGNIDPVKYFLQGQPEDLEAQVAQSYVQAADHEGGYLLGPGCSVPYHTPEENIQAYMEAARRYSRDDK